ncbi:hypothetical protein [Polaromonas sp.]|uniref:hypothetical protein n=1 Tax=Polaromonas sp. TaxID=1869339 RepID=UPI0027300B40|nr:hypothetical protein [Polaromonas sp.]MDP1886640.1 hypothetical protein [Polaromonas sp.]
MPAHPTDCKIGFPKGEEPASAVMRSEMERGVPKQRRISADVMVTQETTVYFDTKQQAIDWETWFYTTINAGADWFDWPDLRTGTTLQARIVGGKPGALVPATVNWAYAQRTFTLEWLRPTL